MTKRNSIAKTMKSRKRVQRGQRKGPFGIKEEDLVAFSFVADHNKKSIDGKFVEREAMGLAYNADLSK